MMELNLFPKEAEAPDIDRSKITWTGPTWNPWQGCIKVSQGCKFCYMYRDKKRYGQDPGKVVRSAIPTFQKPMKWYREVISGSRRGQDRLVFTCSWSDFFIRDADAWRPEAWDIIRITPGLTYQILTKRAERIADHLPPFWDEIAARCWMGISAEDQESLDKRLPFLKQVPAPNRFISYEPALGRIVIPDDPGVNWLIAGSESGGEERRPAEVEWYRSIRDQCRAAGVKFFMKQMEVGGAITDNIHDFPADLRIHDFPVEMR